MPRKPFIIIFIAVCFLVSPVFIILQASFFSLTPVIGPYNIFQKMGAHDVIVLLLYPLCAGSVFFVRRWGWYAYVGASLYLVAANVVVYALGPRHHVLSLVGYNLVLTVTAGIFFRRNVIAPYFNPRVRWWEQSERFAVDMAVGIPAAAGPVPAAVIDISRTGMYIECASLPAGVPITEIGLHHKGQLLRLRVSVVRRRETAAVTGYGLKFVRPGPREKAALRGLVADLKRSGVQASARRAQPLSAAALEEHALASPYRVVRAIKRKLTPS